MRKTKLNGLVAAVAAAGLMLTGCTTADQGGSTETGGGNGGTNTAAAGESTYATVVKLSGVAWFDRMKTGVQNFNEDHENLDAFQQGPSEADSAQQVRVISDLIAQNVDALTVVPFQPDSVESVLARAQEAGITVVTHEAPGIKNADWDIEPFRNADYGAHLMDLLAKGMNEKGQYALMVGSLTSATHMAWVEAAVAHQKEEYPKMEHVGDFIETDEKTTVAAQKTKELLTRYPNLKGIQGSSAVDIVGAGQAIEEAGLAEQTTVVGTSVPSNVDELLQSGAVDVMSGWDPAISGYLMNEIARLEIAGEPIEEGMDLGKAGYEEITIEDKVIYGNAWVDVTAGNVDEYDY